MRRALGKGLSQLIAEQFEGPVSEAAVGAIEPNPFQPRRHFDASALEDLAQSIKEHGILQPLTVRPLSEGRYELIAGERRLRAALLAGLTTVPITVRPTDDKGSLELALIENVQREDIGPLEAARAYRRLQQEFQLTQEQIAERVGKSRVVIANSTRLLKLPQRILEGLEKGTVSEGHARALLSFENEPTMLAVYDRILTQGLNVRDVENLSRNAPAKAKPVAKTKAQQPNKDPNEGALEEALSNYFGSPVKIERDGRVGRIQIEFYSDDDLERILEALGIRL